MNNRLTGYVVLIFLLLFAVRADAFYLRIVGNKLTLHADRVPLQDILQKMAALGITVRIDPQLNPKISAALNDWDIQTGIGSILKAYNHVLIWKFTDETPTPVAELSEIQVFKPGNKERMKTLKPRSNLRVKRNPKDGSLFVANELLLRIGPEMSLSEFKMLLKKIGGIILGRSTTLGIYKIRLPNDTDIPSMANQISQHPGIEKAEPDFIYPIIIPYKNIRSNEATTAYPDISVLTGTAPIAIFDTGLTNDSGIEGVVLESFDALSQQSPAGDQIGHGTQMALIASGLIIPFGATSNAEDHIPLIPIRAIDDNGFTSNFTIMRSIDFSLKNGARVLSLSWGSETRSDFLEEALDYAASKDLIIVASAGNKPTGKETYPAAYSSVIGVGALTPDGNPWKNSNYGDFVSFYAPGFAELPVGYQGEPGLYAGTSISAAYAANMVAVYLSRHPKATIREIIENLNQK